MYTNFYAGIPGKGFEFKKVFSNCCEDMLSDLQLLASSPVQIGDYVIVSYGKDFDTDFSTNYNIDMQTPLSNFKPGNYNASIWQKCFIDNQSIQSNDFIFFGTSNKKTGFGYRLITIIKNEFNNYLNIIPTVEMVADDFKNDNGDNIDINLSNSITILQNKLEEKGYSNQDFILQIDKQVHNDEIVFKQAKNPLIIKVNGQTQNDNDGDGIIRKTLESYFFTDNEMNTNLTIEFWPPNNQALEAIKTEKLSISRILNEGKWIYSSGCVYTYSYYPVYASNTIVPVVITDENGNIQSYWYFQTFDGNWNRIAIQNNFSSEYINDFSNSMGYTTEYINNLEKKLSSRNLCILPLWIVGDPGQDYIEYLELEQKNIYLLQFNLPKIDFTSEDLKNRQSTMIKILQNLNTLEFYQLNSIINFIYTNESSYSDESSYDKETEMLKKIINIQLLSTETNNFYIQVVYYVPDELIGQTTSPYKNPDLQLKAGEIHLII